MQISYSSSSYRSQMIHRCVFFYYGGNSSSRAQDSRLRTLKCFEYWSVFPAGIVFLHADFCHQMYIISLSPTQIFPGCLMPHEICTLWSVWYSGPSEDVSDVYSTRNLVKHELHGHFQRCAVPCSERARFHRRCLVSFAAHHAHINDV